MTWLLFGLGAATGALVATMYWAARCWKVPQGAEHQSGAVRHAKEALLEREIAGLKVLLTEAQDMLRARNYAIAAAKETLDPHVPR